jgi:hypothetical protein
MNNINIKNIFDNNYNLTKSIIGENENKYSFNNISVNDLTPKNNPYVKMTDEFLINKIKYNEYIEKKKINDTYENKYNECLMKINNAIDINITDIIFEISLANFGIKLYNSLECLYYIQKKLRDNNFDTLIISKSQIFVSWKNSNFENKKLHKTS